MKKKGYVYKMVVFIDNLTRLRNLVEFWMTSVIPSHSQRVDCYFRQKNVYIPLSNNQYKMSIVFVDPLNISRMYPKIS